MTYQNPFLTKCLEECPIGTFNLNDSSCQRCDSSCEECVQFLDCTKCKPNLIFYSGICKCNEGFY
jgi:hypothetical protein